MILMLRKITFNTEHFSFNVSSPSVTINTVDN